MSPTEVNAAEVRAIADADCPVAAGELKAPHHCYVDYRGMTKRALGEARLYLFLAAKQRGELPTTDIGHHAAHQATG